MLSVSRTYPPSMSDSKPESNTDSVSISLALAFSQSMPVWSDHISVTRAPSLYFAPLQTFRSGRVAIYCATVFCLLLIDVRTSVSPASFMAPSSEG